MVECFKSQFRSFWSLYIISIEPGFARGVNGAEDVENRNSCQGTSAMPSHSKVDMGNNASSSSKTSLMYYILVVL